LTIEDDKHDIEGGALQNRQLTMRTSVLGQEEEQANLKEVAGDRISEEWMALVQATWKNKNVMCSSAYAYKHIR
jgi:hypothetical protein